MEALVDLLRVDREDEPVLRSVLQDSALKDHRLFLSSQAQEGTISGMISECDAEIALIERQIKQILNDNQDQLERELSRRNVHKSIFNELHSHLEQLWELDNPIKQDSTSKVDKDISSLEIGNDNDVLEDNETMDEFHRAICNLHERISHKNNEMENNDNASNKLSSGLTTVLENIDPITQIMELPFLTRTCICMGHYQEAIMLYEFTNTLVLKFPNSKIIEKVCENVLLEIQHTMVHGLVNLFNSNLGVNSIKKTLQFLNSIPPFKNNRNNNTLLTVYLQMRTKFIINEIENYSVSSDSAAGRMADTKNPNLSESLVEITIKKQIEIVREHLYNTISVFMKNFHLDEPKLLIPLDDTLREQLLLIDPDWNFNTEPVRTNPVILQHVSLVIESLLNQFPKHDISQSICLQLVYCSFRFNDLNSNFHALFLNKIVQSRLSTAQDLAAAIKKRLDLASRYS